MTSHTNFPNLESNAFSFEETAQWLQLHELFIAGRKQLSKNTFEKGKERQNVSKMLTFRSKSPRRSAL